MWKGTLRLVIYVTLTVAVVLVVVYLALPWPVAWRWDDPSSTSFMRYRQKEARERGETLEIRHAWVPLDRIADVMERAVIEAEDGRFRTHGGVDWRAVGDELHYDGDYDDFGWTDPEDLKAVGRAALFYARHRDEVRGRSTITQQLAKNLYFTPERTLRRKVGELVVAKRLERFLDKDRILELYLNTVELGPGLFGVEAAARRYFDVSAAELSPFQAASLAATLPHPLTSNPGHRPARMAWRRDLILARLGGRGGGSRDPVPVAPEPVELPDVDVGDGAGAAPLDPPPEAQDDEPLPDAPAPDAPLRDAPPGGDDEPPVPDPAPPAPVDTLGAAPSRAVRGMELAPASLRR